MKYLALSTLLLTACGGGLDLNGPITVNVAPGAVQVAPDAVECSNCTFPITIPAVEPAASAASAP
jgi:hypothetical protein